jgi:hypothetical protein
MNLDQQIQTMVIENLTKARGVQDAHLGGI